MASHLDGGTPGIIKAAHKKRDLMLADILVHGAALALPMPIIIQQRAPHA